VDAGGEEGRFGVLDLEGGGWVEVMGEEEETAFADGDEEYKRDGWMDGFASQYIAWHGMEVGGHRSSVHFYVS
jgi:hypothetical protein